MKHEDKIDWENGPHSYDADDDGLTAVALLNNPDHSQGEWVKIEDYRKLERELADCRKALQYVLDNHHEGAGEFENTIIDALK